MEIKDILKYVDHTLLKQESTWEQMKVICDDAIKFSTASVCVPPSFVKECKDYCGDKMKICTVIGFPNGYNTTATKVFETEDAIKNGAVYPDLFPSHYSGLVFRLSLPDRRSAADHHRSLLPLRVDHRLCPVVHGRTTAIHSERPGLCLGKRPRHPPGLLVLRPGGPHHRRDQPRLPALAILIGDHGLFVPDGQRGLRRHGCGSDHSGRKRPDDLRWTMAIIVNLDMMLAKRKMTSLELAQRIGMTQANLSILKTGKAKAVRMSTMNEICRILECQPGDLFAYEEDA